jgi:hypothetical protein
MNDPASDIRHAASETADTRPLFPILVKDAAFRPPEEATYYLVTADGLFLERQTPLFSASVLVTGGVPGLQAHQAALTLRIPRLPRGLFERAMGFFRAVYERWRGEAILIMFYAPATQRFALRAPPQVIAGRIEYGRFRADLRLDYRTCERPGPEYVKLGSFHSHGHASPLHSSIDLHDELYESGLHITAGYVNSSLPEFAAAFVVGRTRFTVRPDDVLPPFRTARRPPSSWMEKVVVVCERWGERRTFSTATSWTGAARQDAPAVSVTGRDQDDASERQGNDDGGQGSAR